MKRIREKTLHIVSIKRTVLQKERNHIRKKKDYILGFHHFFV